MPLTKILAEVTIVEETTVLLVRQVKRRESARLRELYMNQNASYAILPASRKISKTWDNIPKAAGRVRKRKPFLKAGSKAKLKNAATVIFVPSTKGSLLLKSLREDKERMSELTGLRSSTRRLEDMS